MSKFFEDNTFSFVDIETNGMSVIDGKIIEVAVIQLKNHEIINEFSTLINPHEDYIPWFIENMTGITLDMLEDQPSFREISIELFELLDDTIFVAHNVSFDYNFIKRKLEMELLELNLERIDTVRISRKLNPFFKSHKLDSLIDLLQIKVESRHRARDDAEVLVKYYQHLLEMHGEDKLEEIILAHKTKRK